MTPTEAQHIFDRVALILDRATTFGGAWLGPVDADDLRDLLEHLDAAAEVVAG